MELHAKLVRSQLSFFKPFVAGLSLEVTRKGQDKLGELMTALHRREVLVRDHDFGAFQGAWVMPKDQRRSGVILYLHGGGYTCGSLDYAKGFAATLASECGVRVFCAAYRLAPEDRFPAALDDAVVSYQYLLSKGYPASQILLCGESAGGGLIYALCLRLKQLRLPLPCGLIGISPWTDLTGSGQSYIDNRDIDPSMTPELLQYKLTQYPDGVGKYVDFIRVNWLGRHTADCVGLIKSYGWLSTDTMTIDYGTHGMPDVGANEMYYSATHKGEIATMPDTPGLAVWKPGHIGVYIGNGEVVEAMGTKYGVVKTQLEGRGWTHWLEVPGTEYE